MFTFMLHKISYFTSLPDLIGQSRQKLCFPTVKPEDDDSLREILPYEVKRKIGTVLNNPHFIVNCQHLPGYLLSKGFK